MRKIKWVFDMDDPSIARDGYTDDTRWNGWLNVWVTPEVHASIVQMGVDDPIHTDPDTQACFESMVAEVEPSAPELGPLISYAGGFTTREVEI